MAETPLNHATYGLGFNDYNPEGQESAVSWCLGLSNVLWTGLGDDQVACRNCRSACLFSSPDLGYTLITLLSV